MTGNERFSRLVQIINDGNYKFRFEVQDPLGVRGVAEVRNQIL